MGGSPRRPSNPLSSSHAEAPEPPEAWLYQKALMGLCRHVKEPPPSERPYPPWETDSGKCLHMNTNVCIWQYEHREHGLVIAKVMEKEERVDIGFCRGVSSCRGFAI